MPPLRALVDAGHDIRLVVTRADRRRSRRGDPEPSPVKAAAIELGLRVGHDVDAVIHAEAELGVVVAFGRIIKPHVLAALPMVNLHFSLLPRWRGAAPVERAILAGDAVTGVCVMAVDEALDTGGVYASEALLIGADEHAEELRARLVDTGTGLLLDVLSGALGEPAPQIGEPTYAEKVSPAELRLDWQRTAEQLDRVVRVGRAWTTFRGRRLLVLRARPVASVLAPGELDGLRVGAGEGALELLDVQPEGRQSQSAADWVAWRSPRSRRSSGRLSVGSHHGARGPRRDRRGRVRQPGGAGDP